jgi:DNA-binding NarL/FixJ family response regulator
MHGATQIFEAVCGESKQVSAQRLLLADSDPIFLHGLAAILGDGFPIAGEVTTGTELLESLQGTDVLISGFSLACGRNALGLLPHIRAHHRALVVIILISPTAASMVPRLRAAGAKGVLSRRTAPQDLPGLVLDALQGRDLPPIRRRSPREDSTPGSVDISVLSARELEIFRLIGLSHSTKEIGALLGISEKTASSHRENIKAKLHLRKSGVLNFVASSYATWEATGADHIA